MVRLIPGRVRNQGIDLYDQGLVSINHEEDSLIEATVDGEKVTYGIDDSSVSCTCPFFQSKKYCQHLAALEYFLKNSEQGKVLSEKWHHQTESKEKRQKMTSFGSLFLDNLKMNEDDSLRFRLSASASPSPFSSDYWWSLKINRLPDDRSYVIRDIKGFLGLIQREGFYQIGKNYYEPLSLIQFDQASQELIQFLWRLAPSWDKSENAQIFPNHARHLFLPSGLFEEGLYLMTDLYDFTFEGPQQIYNHMYVKPLDASAGLFQFIVEVHRKFISLQINEKDMQFLFDNEYILYHDTFYHLSLKQRKIVGAIRSLPIQSDLAKHIHFDLDDQAKLAASLLDFQEIGQVKAPKSFQIRDFKAVFNFDLSGDNRIVSHLTFDFGNFQVTSKQECDQLPFASNYKKEEKLYRALNHYGFEGQFHSQKTIRNPQDLYSFFSEALPYFQKLGKVILSDEVQALKFSERPQVNITRNGGLLDISFDFSQVFEEDIDDALKALFNNDSYFISDQGKLVIFDEETQKISQSLQELRAKQVADGHLQVEGISALQLSQAFSEMDNVHFSQELEELVADLNDPERYHLPGLEIDAVVRDYQLLGIKWLSMLDKYGFGGILADDMGLGKTLQTIAFLSTKLAENTKVLILSPSSLLYNWQDEFQKFASHIDVVVSYGLKTKRDQAILEEHQVTITSYSSFRQDFELYQDTHYDYLILDEAQVIKNAQTKIAQKLRTFNVTNCFALSGTPIENKLLEIWSIFQIVLPGLLPSKKTFLKMEAQEVSRHIQPFVLRRKKEDVLPELPDLIEITYSNEMSDNQKAIYLAQLRQMQERIRNASDSDINRQKIEILSGITRLRQICDTPSLFMEYQGESGKLESLRTLLLQIKENGHRALIFSQFRGMLDIVEQELSSLDLNSYKITGSTPADERQEMTRAFNNGSKDVFLISLKAGGVGLNLTGADTVVLIDLWWNPAVEMQAISRAHRIGQEDNVEVYRLITRGTIEEKILALQESKKNLVTTVLDGNESRASMTVDEIKEILGLNR
ncbi:SNF2 helicase associated domain-containing protein [Streptococcus porcinus]|uniref:Bacterial SNF2 helicase associated n=1 Tax=Streptococcus porcinus TaxID=1340 RepID=A0A4V0HGF3_STRPO|nr:DEAD/DEAH box helicase [Streptococcus porcinus]VTT45580.1 bacterial SNF2 helicase associated [Streptococcus porcinus]VTT47007.1 bacterial SNF2 helicase associated [Streptococcus porcinus]